MVGSRLSTHERRGALVDFLSLDRLMTSSVTHLIYWAGLAVILLGSFGVVGAAIGLAIREGSFAGWLVAIPALVAGLLSCAAAALVWRGVCEFFVAIFQIAEDLRALRLEGQGQGASPLDRTPR
jgi:zinc transporter ZupT